MTKPITIFFRVDVGAAAGMGHLMRCCALAEAFGCLTAVQIQFEPHVVQLARTLLPHHSIQDKQNHVEVLADVVVSDLLYPSSRLQQELRRYGRVAVSISDTPSDGLWADIVIIPNLLPEVNINCTGSSAVELREILLSSGYSVVVTRPVYVAVNRVLFCFGGSDPSGLSMRVMEIVGYIDREAEYRLCIGPFFPAADELRAMLCKRSDIVLVENKVPIIDEIVSCDIAVISGGTLAYETCGAGRPSIVIAQNPDQEEEAHVMHGLGAIRFLGCHDRITDEEIGSAIGDLIDDWMTRRMMSDVARRIIRGDGAAKAAQAILEYVWSGTVDPASGRSQSEV